MSRSKILIAMINLTLTTLSLSIYTSNYVSFNTDPKAKVVNKCRFKTFTDVIKSFSKGLIANPTSALEDVLSCVELYSNSYFMPYSGTQVKTLDQNFGVRVGYGLDCSALPSPSAAIKPIVEKYASIKGDLAYNALKSDLNQIVFTEAQMSNLLQAHFNYFSQIMDKKIKSVKADANFSDVPLSAKISLFIFYFNNYDFIATKGIFSIDWATYLVEEDYYNLARRILFTPAINGSILPTARRLIPVQLLRSLSYEDRYPFNLPEARIAIVVSTHPAVVTAGLKKYLKSVLEKIVTSTQINSLTDYGYLELNLVTVNSKKTTYTDIWITNTTILNGVIDNITAEYDSSFTTDIQPQILDIGKKLFFTNSTENSGIPIKIIFAFTRDVEYVSSPADNKEFEIINCILNTNNTSSSAYPNNYYINSFDNLDAAQFMFPNLWRNFINEVKLDTNYYNEFYGNNKYYKVTKSKYNNLLVYYRDYANANNQTTDTTVTVCISYLNPYNTYGFAEYCKFKLAASVSVYPRSDSPDLEVISDYSTFNYVTDPINSVNEDVYISVNKFDSIGMSIIVRFGECDPLLNTCKTGDVKKLESVYMPAPISNENYYMINVILTIGAFVLILLMIFICIRTPKAEDSRRMSDSHMASR